MKKERTCYIVLPLFVVYIMLLVWIILFKLQFSFDGLDTIRSINLIPFHYENEIGMNFHMKEVIENALIFIPLGIYLCMSNHEPNLKVKLIFILMVSFILEILQYIFAVGRTDVTDLITNTCGGMTGIGLYGLTVKIFHNKRRVNLIISIFATVVTVAIVGLLAILLVSNGR